MDCGKVENCSVVNESKFEVLFGKLGRHVIRTKEDKDNPSCYQRSVQKPASLMVWVTRWYGALAPGRQRTESSLFALCLHMSLFSNRLDEMGQN